MIQKGGDYIRFLEEFNSQNRKIMKKCATAKKNSTCKDADLIALILMLINYFRENKEGIVKEIEVSRKLASLLIKYELKLMRINIYLLEQFEI